MKENKRMIFIGGMPRSGTTLIQGMLCNDDKTIDSTKECTYLRFLVEAYQKGKYTWDGFTNQYFSNRNEFFSFNKQIIDSYFSQLSKVIDTNDKIIVQKHPGIVNIIPDLIELYPDSNFIVMKRDIRDAIASYLKIKRNEGYSAKYFVDMYIGEFRTFNEWCKNVNTNNVLFVQYEDLLTETIETMQEIRNFTGLQLNFDPLDTKWKHKRGTEEYTTELDGKPIDSNNIGKYKDLLAQEEIELIEKNKENIQNFFPFDIFWEKK